MKTCLKREIKQALKLNEMSTIFRSAPVVTCARNSFIAEFFAESCKINEKQSFDKEKKSPFQT